MGVSNIVGVGQLELHFLETDGYIFCRVGLLTLMKLQNYVVNTIITGGGEGLKYSLVVELVLLDGT